MKLRIGFKPSATKAHAIVYIQLGDKPGGDDELLAFFPDPARAELFVKIANGESPPLEHH